jgi:hypothetical protein
LRKKNVKQEFQPSGDVSRVVSLGAGSWAYLMDYNGKTLHFKRDSKLFIDACIENDEKMGGKISRDLVRLGWDDVVEKMSNEN